MKRFLLLACAAAIVLLPPAAGQATVAIPAASDNGVYDNTRHGDRVITWQDWPSGYIYCFVSLNSGDFESLAATRQAALIHAADSLSDYMLRFPLTADRTAADIAGDDNELVAKLRRLADNSPVLEQEIGDEGILTLIRRVRLTGYNSFAGTVLSCIADYQAEPWPAPEPAGRPGQNPLSPYTGLVVDARNLPVTPCLLPSIKTDDLTIYDYRFISPRELSTNAVAAYCRFDDWPSLGDRVGDNPLIVRATGSQSNGTVVTVDADAGWMILRLQASGGVLAGCRVVIVY
ncbi:MAG: hypothetical protein N3A57_00810 [Negativicutes bacterium]|nr:hypothetical protein [Negativicutes bacterium]